LYVQIHNSLLLLLLLTVPMQLVDGAIWNLQCVVIPVLIVVVVVVAAVLMI